jgi:heavy metal translocating P-type ATPase
VVDQESKCDLCGLDTGPKPVVRTFDGEEKRFCCQGCARVYEVAHENGMVDQVIVTGPPQRPGFKDLVLDRGETAHFALGGMWCAGCATAAEQVLRREPGVKDVDISFAAERGRIQYDPARVDLGRALKSLDSLGYRARLYDDAATRVEERQEENTLLQLIAAAAFGMQIMLLYFAQLYPLYAAGDFNSPDVRNVQILTAIMATPVLFFGGSSFLRGAWRALRARTATMDTLVALGTLAAYSYSLYVTIVGGAEAYFDSVAMITTFVMIGRYLEAVGGARARKDVRNLLKLQPSHALRRAGDDWEQVDAHVLAPGDTILVKPGERVPADASILQGQGALNESLLTGESVPVDKGPGDEIYAGTVLADAALQARVTRAPAETRLAQITRLVEQTLAAKPPIQRLADRAATYFAFGILGVAIAAALGWSLSGAAVSQALLTGVAVLVVACPCALGLATPLALTVTLGRTTREGILVRKPAALETAAAVDRIVLDKTGTLTRGEMVVVDMAVDPLAETTEQEMLCLAAAVESFSGHPIAAAIVAACPHRVAEADEFQALGGLGASARLPTRGGHRLMVGSARFVNVDGYAALWEQAEAYADSGKTIVWVGWGEQVIGLIALRDQPNPTARPAVQELLNAGVRPVMLSGDDPRTTKAIANEVGLHEFEGSCPPAEKAARIRRWQEMGQQVAMVGDGVNDAPALAQADLSITSYGGSDVAGETSDIVLTRPDLMLIPWFIRFSRRTRRIIGENLGWAFAYNLVAVPLAAFGLISPVIAAAAMATSSLLVVGNSLRLRR